MIRLMRGACVVWSVVSDTFSLEFVGGDDRATKYLYRFDPILGEGTRNSRTRRQVTVSHIKHRSRRKRQLDTNVEYGARPSPCDPPEETRPRLHPGRLGREQYQGRVQCLSCCEDAHHGRPCCQGFCLLPIRLSSRSCCRTPHGPGHGQQ